MLVNRVNFHTGSHTNVSVAASSNQYSHIAAFKALTHTERPIMAGIIAMYPVAGRPFGI